MTKKVESGVTPRLRFQEFRASGRWTAVELRSVASFVTERVGSTACVPYTVTTGVGLVSQQEKLGRTIAGDSLKNYVVLGRDDFAYNKSATKAFEQGFIARYTGNQRAAVPKSIFTCFRIDANVIEPAYLDFLFWFNLHGKWLRHFIAIGARAHGSLNVSDDDLMSLPVPVPAGSTSLKEQRRIADCLTSLDEVITAQDRKVKAVKAHKRGLMQQLFPRDGETVPRQRFPEFRNSQEWREQTVGSVCQSFSGGTPGTTEKTYYGGAIPFIRSAEIGKNATESFLTEEGLKNSAAKLVEKGDVLMALYGANSGDVAISRITGAINQAILCLSPEGSKPFLYHLLSARKAHVVAKYIQGGQGNLSAEIVNSLTLPFPSREEQTTVGECLTAADAQVAAEAEKLRALRTQKSALLQQLFPVPEGIR
jgi:type I restriction enzyme S subunit